MRGGRGSAHPASPRSHRANSRGGRQIKAVSHRDQRSSMQPTVNPIANRLAKAPSTAVRLFGEFHWRAVLAHQRVFSQPAVSAHRGGGLRIGCRKLSRTSFAPAMASRHCVAGASNRRTVRDSDRARREARRQRRDTDQPFVSPRAPAGPEADRAARLTLTKRSKVKRWFLSDRTRFFLRRKAISR
jgi:hypothetical protein